MSTIPKTMKAVRMSGPVAHYDKESLDTVMTVEEVPVPTPKHGEVLVKMAYSTINPSDLSYLQGKYGKEFQAPCGAGFEGSGTVVASGGGVVAWTLKGKRVAFYGDSAWAEYTVCKAVEAIPVEGVKLEQAAGAVVNPVTALSFIDICKSGGHKSIVHTAAASSLGKMLIRLGAMEGINVICVVRKKEQEESCKNAGATHIFNSNDTNFDTDLKKACLEEDCTLAFDAVSGPLTGRVMSALKYGGEVQVYGALSGEEAHISPRDLIFQNKSVTGFWASQYLKTKGLISQFMWTRKLPKLLEKEASTDYARTVRIDNIAEGLCEYVSNMSAGKTLIQLFSGEEAMEHASVPKELDDTENGGTGDKSADGHELPPEEEAADQKQGLDSDDDAKHSTSDVRAGTDEGIDAMNGRRGAENNFPILRKEIS